MTIYTFYSRRPIDVAIVEASNRGVRAGFLIASCSHSDGGNVYTLVTDDKISKAKLAQLVTVCEGIDAMWRAIA